MLGNRREAVATPSGTRCHMNCSRTGIYQRGRSCPQRGARGDHVVYEQDPPLRRASAALKAGARQPRFPARA